MKPSTVNHYQVYMTLMTFEKVTWSRLGSEDNRNCVNSIAAEPLKGFELELRILTINLAINR